MKKILIIEDEPILVSALTIKLRSAGYSVSTAETGEKGVQLAVSERPDLIFLDLLLPQGSGIEALKKIRSVPIIAKTNVIVLTNLADPESRKEVGYLGASQYLIKSDYTPRKLLEIVQSIIGG